MMQWFDADGEQVVTDPQPELATAELEVCWSDDVNVLREIVAEVIKMRQAQKAYFKQRKYSDLTASKEAERKVDELLKRNGVEL